VSATVLSVVALAFVLLAGLNDGPALTTWAVRAGLTSARAAIGALALALAVVPVLLGPPVANALVAAVGPRPRDAAVAFATAGAVAGALTLAGRPTSITLALLGSVLGVSISTATSAPAQSLVRRGLALGLAAPLAVAVAAWAGTAALSRLRHVPDVSTTTRWAHRAAFAGLCLAYGANDGQKAIAVATLAAAGSGTAVSGGSVGVGIGVGVVFAAGALLGLRLARSTAVVPARTLPTAAAEACSAAAAIGSGLLGTPVSMSQSLTGAVIGSTAASGRGRVRWRLATQLGAAWLVTFPAAVAGAAGLSVLCRSGGW
jgi:inorganic phosphate transporter, PiT family